MVFSRVQDKFAKTILTSEALTLEGRLQRRGHKGIAISVIMERALVGLCGSATKLMANILKGRMPGKKKDSQPPGLRTVILEDTGRESASQLSMRY